MKNFTIKITKKILAKRVNNYMTSVDYYLVYFRMYNENGTKYRKLKYVKKVFKDDIFEYYDADRVTKDQIAEYINESIYCDLESETYTYEEPQNLIKFCNETIKEYNRIRC